MTQQVLLGPDLFQHGAVESIWIATTGAYFRDGVEVYREIDSTYSGKPDQFRWLNTGGMKWGIADPSDGKIKTWKAISPEEVSQEIVAALVKQDYSRVQALMITDAGVAGSVPCSPTIFSGSR